MADYYEEILDTFDNADTPSNIGDFYDLIADALSNADYSLGIADFYRTLAQGVMIWDTPMVGWGKVIADALTITDSAEKILGLLAYDYVKFTELIHTNWQGVDKIEDSAYFLDLAKAARIYLDTLADTFSTSDVATKILALKIIDYLFHDDAASSNLTADRTIADVLSLLDSPEHGFGHTIADSLSMSDTVTSLWILAVIAQDAVNMADALASAFEFNSPVADSVSLADAIATRGDFISIVEDELNFIVSIILDGEVYQCWVLNTDELYPSVYSNYDFNSYAVLQDNVYAAKNGKIYKLEGTTDAGTTIHTGVRMNFYNMGTQRDKRILRAHFGLSGSAPVLKVTNEDESVTYYLVSGKVAEPAKGHVGKTWILDLAEIDDLDFVEITPLILTR